MSDQNTSHAVMQQRSEPRESLDDFPTPMWATRALCEWLKAQGHDLREKAVREPCANRGYMVEPLREAFSSVQAADIFDYGAGFDVRDYLEGPAPSLIDWTITNPPFKLAQPFIDRALQSSSCGVAFFVRTAFLEGQARYDALFRSTPPTAILQFSERVVIHKGVMRRKGEAYIDAKGLKRSASSATSYCWMIWDKRHSEAESFTRFDWIAPCSKDLEKSTDYLPRGHR